MSVIRGRPKVSVDRKNGADDTYQPSCFEYIIISLTIIVTWEANRQSSNWEGMMKANYQLAIALLAGAAIGGVAIQGLHAQATPKAYVITEIEVLDQEAQNAYIPKVGEVIKSTGGTYLARGGKIVALEGGEAPKRVTIVVYDSLEKAQASRNSPAWTALAAERNKAIKAKSYVIEALPN
jgi:uncharacterized protein (DUF1330 family)